MTTTPLRTAVLLPVGLAAALLLTACGNVVADGSGGSDLPLLRIGSRPVVVADQGPTAPDGPFPLVGTLPTGPSSAPVHRYGTAPVPDPTVTRLAAALGLSGSAARHAHGLVVSSSSGELRVRDGGSWSYSRADTLCPGVQVDVDSADLSGTAASCASAGPGSPAVVAPPAQAKALAAPVLDAAGLGSLPARVDDTGGGTALVTVEPSVGGARTEGLATTVSIDADGVASAYGVVGAPAEGPAYPLIPAAQALDVLRAMPRPEMAIACQIGSPCPGVGPQKVTGAELGLLSAYDAGAQVLVPAWFFTVAGSSAPLAVVAVADRYLADAAPTGGAGSGSGSAGSSGSAIPPGEPSTPQPAPTASDLPLPAGPATPYRVTSYSGSADATTLTLRTEGGLCPAYSASSTETAGTVTVTIIGRADDQPGKVCPAVMTEVEVPLGLGSRLGDRTVVDATSGATVPRR